MIALYTSTVSLVRGGIENTSYLLCKGLSKSVGVIAAPLNITDELEDFEIDVLDNRRRNKLMKYICLFKSHHANRKQIKYSLCLTWKYAIVPYLLFKLLKKPYGVMMHGSDLMPISNVKGLKVIILNRIRKKILSNATHLFANSEFTRELLKNNFENLDAIVIHPPISYEKPFEKVNYNVNHVLLSIGRSESRKGFQDCILAVDILKEKYPMLEYRIAGTGPYLEELKRLVKEKNLEKWVVFLGRISEDEKLKQYHEADIVMMPSRTETSSVEGFGIVFVEANMFGCPALGSKSGGISDAIIEKKTGWIINEDSPYEIAERIDELFSDNNTFLMQDLYNWGMAHSYVNISKEYLAHIEKDINLRG